MRLKEFLEKSLHEVDKGLLPSHAKIMGGVALVRLRPELDTLEERIGELILRFYKVRAVYRIYGVTGIERRPLIKHIAGEKVREIIHKEYGYSFRLDLTRLMLCLGNSYERLRTAALTRDGETVIDMFAGIGQFSIPIAVLSNPGKIYAVEINPEAYKYLLENIGRNGVEESIEAFLGDCKEIVADELRESADRVVMGYLGGTLTALESALMALRPEGGIIHFHELVRRGREVDLITNILKTAGEDYLIKVLNVRKVKSYSRTRDHIVIDLFSIKRGYA